MKENKTKFAKKTIQRPVWLDGVCTAMPGTHQTKDKKNVETRQPRIDEDTFKCFGLLVTRCMDITAHHTLIDSIPKQPSPDSQIPYANHNCHLTIKKVSSL